MPLDGRHFSAVAPKWSGFIRNKRNSFGIAEIIWDWPRQFRSGGTQLLSA